MFLLVLQGLSSLSAFEFQAGTTFDSNCVSSMCADELVACEADRGDLSDNRSHCRTLLFCVSQMQRESDLNVPASRVTDLSACTSGVSFADMTPAASKLTSCLKANHCMVGAIKDVDALEANAAKNFAAPIVKSFDVSCLRKSCQDNLTDCTSNPLCKAMSECLAIKNGDPTAMALCTSRINALDRTQEALVSCGTENKCIDVMSAAVIKPHGVPSSFFQIANSGAITEPWRQIQEETKLRLKQLHEKLFKTNERVQQNLKLEKENLNKIKAFEESQKARLAGSKAELESTFAKLDSKKSSFIEADPTEASDDSVFDHEFGDALADIKNFALFDQSHDEESGASFLETGPASFEAEANAKIDEVLQRGRAQADASAQHLSEITAQLRRQMQHMKPVSLVETNDDYSSRARKKLNDLKKILAQQSNLLNQLGKVSK